MPHSYTEDQLDFSAATPHSGLLAFLASAPAIRLFETHWQTHFLTAPLQPLTSPAVLREQPTNMKVTDWIPTALRGNARTLLRHHRRWDCDRLNRRWQMVERLLPRSNRGLPLAGTSTDSRIRRGIAGQQLALRRLGVTSVRTACFLAPAAPARSAKSAPKLIFITYLRVLLNE
jgi:hypothetical protein